MEKPPRSQNLNLCIVLYHLRKIKKLTSSFKADKHFLYHHKNNLNYSKSMKKSEFKQNKLKTKSYVDHFNCEDEDGKLSVQEKFLF